MSKKDFWDGYVPEPAYTLKPTSKPIIAAFDMKPNHNMTFHNQDGKQVGELNFNGPEMTFSGDAEESAKVFFDFIASAFKAQQEPASVTYKEVTDAMNALYAGDIKQVQIAMMMGSKKLYTSPPAQHKQAILAEREAWCMKMNRCETKCDDCPHEAAKPAQPEQSKPPTA